MVYMIRLVTIITALSASGCTILVPIDHNESRLILLCDRSLDKEGHEHLRCDQHKFIQAQYHF